MDDRIAYSVPLITAFIAENKWAYAKTMPRAPHCYLLRKRATDDRMFNLFVLFIREFGYDQFYGKTRMRYSDFEDMRYWTMGDLLEGTILINQARIYRPPYPHVKNPRPFIARAGAGDRAFRKNPKKS